MNLYKSNFIRYDILNKYSIMLSSEKYLHVSYNI